MRSPDGPFRQRRILRVLPVLLFAAGTAHAGRVSVQLDGVDGTLRDAVMAAIANHTWLAEQRGSG